MAKLDVFLGIDFGTSFTKVCYNINGTTYVYKNGNSPFIPTELYYSTSNNIIFLKKSINENEVFKVKYFKYSMAFDGLHIKEISDNLPIGYKYKELANIFSIFFLSDIIKNVKKEILNFTGIKPENINIEINMSAPINDYRGGIYDLYRSVLISAFLLSQNNSESNSISIEDVKKIFKKVESEYSTSYYEQLKVHPEIFIEAVHFINKPGYNFGSYVIMDIGGGTVDVGILWKREWEGREYFDLIVINIIKYGIEVLKNKLEKELNDEVIINILKNWLYENNNKKAEYIDLKKESELSSDFLNNLKKMIDIEENALRNGIKDIKSKRIFYSGGGYNFSWYKKNISNIGNHQIVEDKYQIEKIPQNIDKKVDLHRLVIAMELAQPEDRISQNMGSTTIITGQTKIPGTNNFQFDICETNIIREVKKQMDYYDLQDRQRELYGEAI